MKKVLALSASTLMLLSTRPTSSLNVDEHIDKKYYGVQAREIFDWEKHYEETIAFIKSHEGFNSGELYHDLAGYPTIGYGHVVWPGEEFKSPITERQADSLLRRDFADALRSIERNTDLKDNKKLAMAHFVFSRGIGRFLRSDMKKLIDENKPIDDEIVKWCYYRDRKGRMVKSELSLKLRKWELELYNKTFRKDY